MKEILFRGKSLGNGKWIEGNLVIDTYDEAGKIEKIYRIIDTVYGIDGYGFSSFQSGYDEIVNSATIGQFTGLTDKNGKKIFEGDIIRAESFSDEHMTIVAPVEFDEAGFCAGRWFLQAWLFYGEFRGEVIGNVYDNPELLEDT